MRVRYLPWVSEQDKLKILKKIYGRCETGPTMRDELGDCWTYFGTWSDTGEIGIGQITVFGISYPSHYVVQCLENRRLAEGEEPDHLCHNTLCCRPSHLVASTVSENRKSRRKFKNRTREEKRAWAREHIKGEWREHHGRSPQAQTHTD